MDVRTYLQQFNNAGHIYNMAFKSESVPRIPEFFYNLKLFRLQEHTETFTHIKKIFLRLTLMQLYTLTA